MSTKLLLLCVLIAATLLFGGCPPSPTPPPPPPDAKPVTPATTTTAVVPEKEKGHVARYTIYWSTPHWYEQYETNEVRETSFGVKFTVVSCSCGEEKGEDVSLRDGYAITDHRVTITPVSSNGGNLPGPENR